MLNVNVSVNLGAEQDISKKNPLKPHRKKYYKSDLLRPVIPSNPMMFICSPLSQGIQTIWDRLVYRRLLKARSKLNGSDPQWHSQPRGGKLSWTQTAVITIAKNLPQHLSIPRLLSAGPKSTGHCRATTIAEVTQLVSGLPHLPLSATTVHLKISSQSGLLHLYRYQHSKFPCLTA